MTLTLPIPDRRLWPNSRAPWQKRQQATRSHRQRAFFATLEALGVRDLPTRLLAGEKKKLGITGPLHSAAYQRLSRLFHPGDVPKPTGYSLAFHVGRMGFDDDNADASVKAYRDGIADALRLDDRDLRKVALSTFQRDPSNPRLEITLHS